MDRIRKSITALNKQKVGSFASAIKKRKSVIYNDGTNITKYESLSQAAKDTGYSISSIQRWCNKNIKGWVYATECNSQTDTTS